MTRFAVALAAALLLALPGTARADADQPTFQFNGDTAQATVLPPSDPAASMRVTIDAWNFCLPACSASTYSIKSHTGWNGAVPTDCVVSSSDPQTRECNTTLPIATLVTGTAHADRVEQVCAFSSTYSPKLTVVALAGADVLAGACNDDMLGGGPGNDTLIGSDGNDLFDAGDGRDELVAGAGADALEGGPGDDTLTPGTGSDNVKGDDGSDTVSYADRAAPVTIDLGAGTAGEAGETDVLTAIENATGGAAGDKITGSSEANLIEALEGDDTIAVRDGGGDFAACGAGTDTATADAADAATGCETVDVPAPEPTTSPTPRVTASVDAQFAARKRTRVLALRVLDPPPDMTLAVRCLGKKCFSGTRSRSGPNARPLVRKIRFRPGQKLELRLLVPGQTTKILTYRMRKRRPPAVTLSYA